MSQSSIMAVVPTFGDQSLVPVLGQEAQKLISCNQKLQELGINDTIRLPRIVVIGDQSTGKSSLIEAISTIKVPKSANLCTRCPIAINLTSDPSSSPSWRCTVYIEERYSFDTVLRRRKVSKANPLGPWQLHGEVKTTTIKTTEHPRELLDLIHVAQQLLLNPTHDRDGASDVDNSDDSETFSPNTIRLDISSGNWPNLSFVDLPGVIQSAGRGQPEYYVGLVESLARVYARDRNNVIMLTLPINHDVSNSKSYSIIQQEEAQSRTLAVFTKVDLAREEERQDCLDKYFSDEAEEEFEYGHQMVMLASSCQDRTEAEDDFFSQLPWSRLPQTVRQRFGVRNLTTLLRHILFQKTSETLPGNLEKVQNRLAQVKDSLDGMPEPPDALELPYQLRERVHIFEGNVGQLFTSKRDPAAASSSSRSKLMHLMQAFNNRVSADKPIMVIKTEEETNKLLRAEQALSEGSVEDPVSQGSDSSPLQQFTAKSTQKSSQKVKKNDGRAQRFRLEEIRHLNQQHYQSSVPGDIEPAAVEEMHRMSVQHWGTTFREFMAKISGLINDEVLRCVCDTFGKQKHLSLYIKVEELVRDHLDIVIQDEWTNLERACDAERKHPLTFNTASVKSSEVESLAQRRTKRAEARLEIARAVQKAQNVGKKRQKELSLEDIGADPWDVEVQMAARTKAYYEVASHRFVDSVCQQIFVHLIPRCQNDLVRCIKENLGLNDIPRNRATIVALMSEDPEREAHRARLISEMERLNEGHAYIASVLGAVGSPHLTTAISTADGSVYADAIMSDDATTLPVYSPPDISPSKRKADGELHGQDASSPSKRMQTRNVTRVMDHGAARDGRQHTPLTDRSRSHELEE